MNKYLFFLAAFIFIGCSEDSPNEPTYYREEIPNLLKVYDFDVKTSWDDKSEYTWQKHGLLCALENHSSWAKERESFEDYSLWIKNATIDKNSETRNWTFKYDLELREPSSLVSTGELLNYVPIEFIVSYDRYQEMETIGEGLPEHAWKIYKDALLEMSKEARSFPIPVEHQITLQAAEIAINYFSNLLSTDVTNATKGMCYMIGDLSMYQVKKWMWEKEEGQITLSKPIVIVVD